MKRLIFLILLLLAGSGPDLRAQTAPVSEPQTLQRCDSTAMPAKTINELRAERGLTTLSNLFVPRGQWIFGGTASYSVHYNDTYSFAIIDGIQSEGYTFRISPMVAYAFRSNMALGARFIYSRSLLRIDAANLKFGDSDSGIDLNVEDYYALQHSYTGAAIWRTYIPLGNTRRFAIFTEMQLTATGSQAKFAADQPVRGTFQRGYSLGLGLAPGLVAFATNNMAIEINVGVMGINYSSTRQVHNQVSVGKRSSSSMNFKVNLFSIGLGAVFYL